MLAGRIGACCLLASAAFLGGCSDDDAAPETTTTTSSTSTDATPTAAVITSFNVELSNPNTAEVSFDLAEPARLRLALSGYPNGASGVIAVDAPGDPLTGKGRLQPKGDGSSEVRFNFPGFDFSEPDQLEFKLVARTQGGSISRSEAVVVSRTN